VIRQLGIRGFKRFTEHSFELRPMTVLAGMNGAGKTSVVHALLLVREACRRRDGVVELNGPFGLELGGFEDVLNHQTINSFAITLAADGSVEEGRVVSEIESAGPIGRPVQLVEQQWVFTEGDTALYATVAESAVLGSGPFVAKPRSFQYVSAERLGPRITQGSAALPPSVLEVGCRGEYCAQVLDTLGTTIVEEGRCCLVDAEIPPLLKAQTEQWLSRVTRPLQIDTETFAGTGVTAMKFRTGEDWVKPPNMGFGITCTLPVILAGLTAGTGGLLLIENPEAHLHPAGQSQIGVFLATMAAAGIQIIVETHSDHVLNGIRRTIGEQQLLQADQAIVHYFDAEASKPQDLFFTGTGGVSSWPSGFFDQYQLDVAALTRVRRPR
jgi:predicted ATPase